MRSPSLNSALRVSVFINDLGLGGTEKAAVRWAWGLLERHHQVAVLALKDGPRRAELEQRGVPVRIVGPAVPDIARALRDLAPEVIHAHAPGHPHEGDVLGEALQLLPKIPVVQTNIFGHLTNPKEDVWTDFRLYISWTSCVQAARRSFQKLDERFFHRASVAVYPLDPVDAPPPVETAAFRHALGVTDDEILFGRLSRPEPNKWTSLALDAFRLALKHNPRIKLLLREPPPQVVSELRASADAGRFIILPATSDAEELTRTMSALDALLHTSSIGESFGYGIAEPMNLGKPVITHSVPWQDQAQIELVRHGECGFVVSTPRAMAGAILKVAADSPLRERMGGAARIHIRQLANLELSLDRLEGVMRSVCAGLANQYGELDLRSARAAAQYLDQHQFGHSFAESLALLPFYYWVRFNEFRRAQKRG